MITPDQYQVAYDQYHELLYRARKYVVYMASENPLREYWQGFVVDDCTMHLDVGVVTLKEPENTGGGTPRSVHFLLTSLCADWRRELHADLLTDIQRDVKEITNAEYQEYLAFRARFEGE